MKWLGSTGNILTWRHQVDIKGIAKSGKQWQKTDTQTDREKSDRVTDNASIREACT